MRRLAACAVLLLIALVVPAPALAADSPDPTPSPTATPTAPEPATQPTDGIREIPTQDDGADFYSVATILLFFVIAMGVFVFIIRAGMRSADRED